MTEGRDLIFNPDWVGLAVYEPGRSDWPYTVASELPIEVVGYQEVIHDNQSPSGFYDNNYNRQFNSFRTGFARR
ncbi:MAG: hypothetical protein HY287_16365 [Planctomycetes bacterium]|nr:hypothetical protein [Planctomycetota bacterium]